MELLTEKFAKEITPFLNTPAAQILKDIYVFEPNDSQLLDLNPEQSIIIGNNSSIDIIADLCYSRNNNHFIQSHREDFFFELFASSLLLKNPNLFLKNKLLFFFSKNNNPFTNGVVEEKVYHFTNSAEKHRLIDQIELYISNIKALKPFAQNILTIADELITNALFNAPIDKERTHLFKDLDRKSYVSFLPPKFATLLLAYNNEKFFISCEDPFGSLTKETIKNRFFELYYKNNTTPIEGHAGRGLGFKIIADNSCVRSSGSE